jgi:hypothetical protein
VHEDLDRNKGEAGVSSNVNGDAAGKIEKKDELPDLKVPDGVAAT